MGAARRLDGHAAHDMTAATPAVNVPAAMVIVSTPAKVPA
jgi:hypothetical protein